MSPPFHYQVLMLAIAGYATSVVPPPVTATANRDCWYSHTTGRKCFNIFNTGAFPDSQGLLYDDVADLGFYIRAEAEASPYHVDGPEVLVVFAGQDDNCQGIGCGMIGELGMWFLHTDVTVTTVVLMEAVARTVGGGHVANGSFTDPTQQSSLMYCASDGGVVNILVSTSHPFYSSNVYKSRNYTWTGLLVDIENYAKAIGT